MKTEAYDHQRTSGFYEIIRVQQLPEYIRDVSDTKSNTKPI